MSPEFREADPQKRLAVLAPYLEAMGRGVVENRAREKLLLAEELGRKISEESRPSGDKIALAHQPLLALCRLNSADFLALRQQDRQFVFPVGKLRQVLSSLGEAKIIWEPAEGILRVLGREGKSRTIFTLNSQPVYLPRGKTVFTIDLRPAIAEQPNLNPPPTINRRPNNRGFSIADLLLKAAESVLNL